MQNFTKLLLGDLVLFGQADGDTRPCEIWWKSSTDVDIASEERCCGDVQSAQRSGISDALPAKSIGQITRSKRISDGETGETMDLVEDPTRARYPKRNVVRKSEKTKLMRRRSTQQGRPARNDSNEAQ